MVQCTKKKIQRVPLGGGMLEQHPGTQKHSLEFFYFSVIACISALNLSNSRLHTRIACQETRVYLQVT